MMNESSGAVHCKSQGKPINAGMRPDRLPALFAAQDYGTDWDA